MKQQPQLGYGKKKLEISSKCELDYWTYRIEEGCWETSRDFQWD